MFERDELMARNGVIEAISPIEVLVNGEGDLAALADSVSPGSVAYTPGEARRWQLSPAREWVECAGSLALEPLSVTENGAYAPPKGVGYGPVTVAVPMTEMTPLRAEKNGVYTPGEGGAYGPVTVAVSDGVPDVGLYDYDGTLLHAYTAEEFAALTELPANPSHEGLTAQGWNWTLEDAKAHVAKYGLLAIGQTYVTDDGDTRIYIHLPEDLPENRKTFYLYIAAASSGEVVEIDWGDESAPTRVTASYGVMNEHDYAAGGDYVIHIRSVDGGRFKIDGTGMSADKKLLFGYADDDNDHNQVRIRRIELGSNVASFKNYPFSNCKRLETITIPNGLTEIGAYGFAGCYNLKYVVFPSSMTTNSGASLFDGDCNLKGVSIPKGMTTFSGTSTFKDCVSLRAISLPEGVATIPGSAFRDCHELTRVAIPDTVTSINGSAFYNCYALAELELPDSVTTIGSSLLTKARSLRRIRLPKNLTEIPGSFIEANSLESIEMPETLAQIGSSAFNCEPLTKLVFPSSLTSIAASAFAECKAVTEYWFYSTTPPTLANANAFYTLDDSRILPDAVIYVPAASLNAYKAANNWSAFASNMRAMPAA